MGARLHAPSIAAWLAAIALPAASLAFAGDAALPGHEHGAAHAVTLDAGRKWASDAPLREGMARIRDALGETTLDPSRAPLPAARSRTLAGTIEKEVAGIVANCKLPPAADANLHVILGELVAASDAMRSDAGDARARGAQSAHSALDEYARIFDDPAFASGTSPRGPS